MPSSAAAVDAAIRQLSARQFDAFSRGQVFALGGTDKHIARRLRTGAWQSQGGGVYTAVPRSRSWGQRLWIAHLQVGLDSVISHEAAAAVYELSGFPSRAPVLTVAHPSHRQAPGAVVHQSTDLSPLHVVRRFGTLPVTSPARTIVDLAAVATKARVRAALESAVVHRRVELEKVGAITLSLLRPGKKGLIGLTQIIEDLGPYKPVPDSEMEYRFFRALRDAGEPEPVRQFPHPGRLPGPGRTDGTYTFAKLICEVDGRSWHTRRVEIQRDHARDNAAARAGYDTLRILCEDLIAWPEDVVALVRDVRLQREAVIRALQGV